MVAHQMTNRIFILIFSLLMIVCASTAGAEVVAKADRTNIVIDETLTLTIIKDGSSFFTDPDLDPLQKDFKVLGRSQQSSTLMINGKASSSVSWKITLAPRRAGKLEIPPLVIGKEKTNPLTVRVSADAQPKTSADNTPIFIETDVDEQSVFVQSQVIYSLRVYWAIDVKIFDPEEPDISDALIEKLEDTTFQKVIDGTTYWVFERKYAIFPQKSGVLKIPQIIIQVNIPSRQSRRNIFDPFGSKGETLKLRSEREEVIVREKPQEYPVSAIWLPSAGLIIKDKWSQSPQDMKVGESVTLSLSLIAEGLMSEQLPPLELVEPDGVKLYQGKAELENLTISTGIIGTRTESIALIPTRPGEIEFPEVRIPWWDKKNQKVEYAVIPARKLMIQGTVEQLETLFPDAAHDNNAQVVPETQVVQLPVPQAKSTGWIILCAVFAVAWLVTLCLLFYTRRQMDELAHGQARNSEKGRAMKEREAFNSFAKACKANDPAKARVSVMSWAMAFWPNEQIRTSADIFRIVPDSELMSLLHEIDSVLYSHEKLDNPWQGEKLLGQVKNIRTVR
jgi:hypothetical protein